MRFPKPERKKKDRKAIRKKSIKPIPRLKEKLQTIFNRYIVLRDGQCITCGSTKNLQCSHYFSVGAAPSIRYNEMNAHCQCMACHNGIHARGNSKVVLGSGHEYTMYMLGVYGEFAIAELKAEGSKSHKWTIEELTEKIDYYSNLVRSME